MALLSAVYAFLTRMLSHDVLCSLGCRLNTSAIQLDTLIVFFFKFCVNIFISWISKFFPPLTKVLYLAKRETGFEQEQTHQASAGQPTLVRDSLEGKRTISGGETQTDPSCMRLGGYKGFGAYLSMLGLCFSVDINAVVF